MENQLEQESEFLVNKLTREKDALLARNAALQAQLEQVQLDLAAAKDRHVAAPATGSPATSPGTPSNQSASGEQGWLFLGCLLLPPPAPISQSPIPTCGALYTQ